MLSPAGEVLLIRRSDDWRWAMPGGWMEPGETAEAAAVREAQEETGLIVTPVGLIGRLHRRGSVHHTVHCRIARGELRPSDESPEVAFRRPEGVTAWHADHGERVAAAVAIVGGRG